MKSGTTARLFELAMAGEKTALDFYEGLAKKFGHETDVAEFWSNMAADERKHIKILEGIMKHMTPVQRGAPVDPYVFGIAAENAKVQIADVLDLVTDLDDAYELAQLWEHSEINKVFEYLATEFVSLDDKERIVLALIIDHINKLTKFAQAFGNSELRKRVKAVHQTVRQLTDRH